MEPLQIHLFGGFLLTRGGVSLPPIASRAGRSLFAHLVMNRDRPLQRDLLAGTFWPDLPESRARRRLSHTLWQIQDVVNTEAASHLDVTPDTLSFKVSTPYWLDVEEFDRNYDSPLRTGSDKRQRDRLEADRLSKVVDLYRGDFLAGYFDDWALIEQDHYRQRYLTALGRLIDATKANGAYSEALSFARRLTHHDHLNEEAHREVMRLSFLLGRNTDAIEQFERCVSVLEEELGTKPSAPTVEIYEKILKQRNAGVRPLREEETTVLHGRRANTPFVGREDERRILVDSLERVLAGSGGVALIEGEPGVGKTRLTIEAAEDARWRGFEVSWGSCMPGTLRPFAPLIEVLESLSPLRVEQLSEQVAPVWLAEAARLSPRLAERVTLDTAAQLRPAEASTRMIEALVHTLGALGEIAPHLVIIDDVHWADQDTLSVLMQVGTRLANSRVLLMLLYRSEEARGDAHVWDVMRDLDRLAGLGRVVLSPLSVFELEEMIRRIIGVARLDTGIATQLHRQTGGNALFTLETLMAMRDRGLFEPGSDPMAVLESQIADSAIPVAPRVRSVIEARMSQLGPDVTAVYQLAAVCGDRIDLRLLETATDLPRATVLNAVDELLYRGLMSDDGNGFFRVAHDQVRQVVYDDIHRSRRIALHRAVGESLAKLAPDNIEATGHHFREGGDVGRAAEYLRMAGLRAMRLNAYATARHHLQSARECAASAAMDHEVRFTLLGELEDVLNVLGARSAQEEVIAEMTGLAKRHPMRGDVERRRAWLAAQVGDLPHAGKSAKRSLAAERKDGEAGALAASLIALGTIQRWSGQPLDAVPSLEEAVEVSRDDSQRADALTELASSLVEVQQSDEALPHLHQAGAIYRRLDDLRGLAEVAGIEARAHRLSGDRDRATSQYEAAIDLCRRIGYRHGEGVNLTNLANLHQLLGSVADALARYDQAAQIFDELGNRRGEAMVLANSASARHHLLGEDQRAHTDATRALRHFTEIGDRARQAQCQEIIAGIVARRGDLAEAGRMLEKNVNELEETGNVVLQVQHLRSLALLHLDAKDIPAATAALDRAESLCSRAGLDELQVDLQSIRGMAHLASGSISAAVRATRTAVKRLTDGVERPYLVLHRHALAAEAAGDIETAREAGSRAAAALRKSLDGLAPEDLQKAIGSVPEHGAIIEAAGKFAPVDIEVWLPAVGAPTGKALDDTELRLVSWTIEHPDDQAHTSAPQRRRHQLLRLLDQAEGQGAVPSSEHLAQALAVSASTVRRDLAELRRAGYDATSRGQRRRAS